MKKRRLIATLGATKGSREHTYYLGDSSYATAYSMGAIAKHFKVDEVFVIGTEETKKMLEEHPPTLEMPPRLISIPMGGNIEERLYNKAIELFEFDGEVILDVTQGYRAFPILTTLAAMVPQHGKKKTTKLLDIFYASPLDPECHPSGEKCEYRFVSLLAYMDSANMSETIQAFVDSLSVPDYPVYYREFQPIRDKLRSLSKDLVNNDIANAGKKAKSISSAIENTKEKMGHMEKMLGALKSDIEEIILIASRNTESEKLFLFSEYMMHKGFNLHSVTLLYEAVTQYLLEYVEKKGLGEYFVLSGNRKCFEEHTLCSKKNCLKKSLSSALEHIDDNKLKILSHLLYVLDRMRNTAAHAFLDKSTSKKLLDIHKKLGLNIEWSFDKKLSEIHTMIGKHIFEIGNKG